MPRIREPKLDCRCIDAESLANLRLSLITAKDTYKDISTILMGTHLHQPSDEVKSVQEQARKFDALLHELDKIPQC